MNIHPGELWQLIAALQLATDRLAEIAERAEKPVRQSKPKRKTKADNIAGRRIPK